MDHPLSHIERARKQRAVVFSLIFFAWAWMAWVITLQ